MNESESTRGTGLSSGRNASVRAVFRQSLDQMGIELSTTAFEQAVARMTTLADHSGHVSRAQIRSIVEEVVSGIEVMDEVAATFA